MNDSASNETSRLQLQAASSGTGNSVAVTGIFLLEHQEELERSHIPFYRARRRQDGKLGVELINFVTIESLSESERSRKQFIIHKEWQKYLVPGNSDPFSLYLADYISLGPEGRAKEVTVIRKTIEALRHSDVPPMAKAEAIMSAVEKTFVINKASLQLNRSSITDTDHTVANETQAMVNSALAIVDESHLTGQLFECFKSLSNGQTINHITRVFTTYTAFLHYFNRLQNQRISQKIRLIFQNEYLEHYRMILPELPPHLYTSDNLVQLPHIEPPELKKFALGAFLHDIGKMANIDYFESDAAYNPLEIRQHVFVSSGLILMNYGVDHEEARIMAGDHHNALFHKDGYSVTRWERERSERKLAETQRCITNSLDEYGRGMALGYLPVELLAIVDIYDAMTDNSRLYKKGMTPTEAIQFMTNQALAAGKIDPMLFDIFIDFLMDTGIEVPEEAGFFFKFRQRKA